MNKYKQIMKSVLFIILLLPISCITTQNMQSDDYVRAKMHISNHEYETGIELLNQLIVQNPEETKYYFKRGFAYSKIGEYEKAANDFVICVNNRYSLRSSSYNAGTMFFYKAKYEQAVYYLTIAIQLDPEYTSAYTNRSLSLAEMFLYDEAIKDASIVLKYDSSKASHYSNRGNHYLDTGEFELAFQDFSQAVLMEPDNSTINNNMGYYYFTQRNFDTAREYFDKAIALDNKNGKPYSNKARSYYLQNEYTKAIQVYNEKLVALPKSYSTYRSIGWNNFLLGEEEKAYKMYELAKKNNTNDQIVFLELAELEISIGNINRAKAHLNSVSIDYLETKYHLPFYFLMYYIAVTENDTSQIVLLDMITEILNKCRYIGGWKYTLINATIEKSSLSLESKEKLIVIIGKIKSKDIDALF
jgi:tetratricopeptide (TPR) repeat protein